MPRRMLSLLFLILSLSAEAETFTGKVVGIADGDTITVLVAERTVKVRLAEIDTPERGQPWPRGRSRRSPTRCIGNWPRSG